MAIIEGGIDRPGVADLRRDGVELAGVDAVCDKAQRVGVGSPDRTARKPEVGAGLARQAAKHVTDTDVRGKSPIIVFRHCKRIVLAGDAMRSVLRDAARRHP